MLLPAVLLAAAIGAAAGDEGIGLVGEGEGGALRLAWRSPAVTPPPRGRTHRPPAALVGQWTADHGSSMTAITPKSPTAAPTSSPAPPPQPTAFPPTGPTGPHGPASPPAPTRLSW